MPFDLAPGEHNRLPGSPLTLVVCQVRFEATPAASDAATVLAIHESLGGKDGQYPILERAQVTPQLPPQVPDMHVVIPQIPVGWRYRSQDGTWMVTISPDSVALETTTAYTSWDEDFRARLMQLVNTVSERISPAMVHRVGLRYIDQITQPGVDAPGDWQPFIAPELLGPLLHPTIGGAIIGAQQQLEIDIGDGARCNLRHGLVRDPANAGRLTYILDTDAFRDEIGSFNVEQIMSDAERFHDVALAIFQTSITPELKSIFEQT